MAWKESVAVAALADHRWLRARLDQCQTGLSSPSGGLHLKPTLIRATDRDMQQALSLVCPRLHPHDPVEGSATVSREGIRATNPCLTGPRRAHPGLSLRETHLWIECHMPLASLRNPNPEGSKRTYRPGGLQREVRPKAPVRKRRSGRHDDGRSHLQMHFTKRLKFAGTSTDIPFHWVARTSFECKYTVYEEGRGRERREKRRRTRRCSQLRHKRPTTHQERKKRVPSYDESIQGHPSKKEGERKERKKKERERERETERERKKRRGKKVDARTHWGEG